MNEREQQGLENYICFLTVLSGSSPDAFLTAWLMVSKYSAVLVEYTLATSSKNMPCTARGALEFVFALAFLDQPEYVETSWRTEVRFLDA